MTDKSDNEKEDNASGVAAVVERAKTLYDKGHTKVTGHLEARRAYKASPEYLAEQEQKQREKDDSDTIAGINQTIKYINTNENSLKASVGAHFLMNLSKAGENQEVLNNFIIRFVKEKHNIALTETEQECLDEAGDQTTLVKGFRNTHMLGNIQRNLFTRRSALFMIGGGAAGAAAAAAAFADPVTAILASRFKDRLPDFNRKEALVCDRIFADAMTTIDGLPEGEQPSATIMAMGARELCQAQDNINRNTKIEVDEENVDLSKVAIKVLSGMAIGFLVPAVIKGGEAIVSQGMQDTKDQAIGRISQMDVFCNNRLERNIVGSNNRLLRQNHELLTQVLEVVSTLEEIDERTDPLDIKNAAVKEVVKQAAQAFDIIARGEGVQETLENPEVQHEEEIEEQPAEIPDVPSTSDTKPEGMEVGGASRRSFLTLGQGND